jgi:hypothetical protein
MASRVTDLEVVGADDADIRRHLVARFEQYDVTRHQSVRLYGLRLPVPLDLPGRTKSDCNGVHVGCLEP